MTLRDRQNLPARLGSPLPNRVSGSRKEELLAARRRYYRQNHDYELTRDRAYRAGKVLGLTTGQVLALWCEPPLRRPGKGKK